MLNVSHLSMAVFKLFPVAFQLFFAGRILSQDTCRIVEFTEPEAGSYLEHHVIQSTVVDNNDQCKINCYVEEKCLSYNLGLLPGSGNKFICELSESDHYQHPEHLVSKNGFSYHPTAKLCGGDPCPPASSCIPDLQGKLRCVCPSYWPKIENCEKKIFDKCYDNAIGVADPTIIPDSQMTSSSQFSNYNYKPAYGRLNDNRGDGWCAKKSDGKDDWLQVDLGRTIQVCAVATQGDRNGDEWVIDFKLSYSLNENEWIRYVDYKGNEVEFHREGGSLTVNQHIFPVLLSAKYIRFHPTKQHKWNCLRVEVYGTNRFFFHWKLDGQDPFVSLHGGTSFQSIDGKTALYLDGAPGSYAETPAIPIQAISFSVLCWVKVLSPPEPQSSVNIYSDWAAPYQFRIFGYDGELQASLRLRQSPSFGIIYFRFPGGHLTIGEWIHVAFTWSRDNRTGKLYVDGAKTGEKTVTVPQGILDLNPTGRTVFDIGLKRDSPDKRTLHGYLRDLMVIDREIPEEELKTIFAWSKN